jgi:hypothetical protein
MVVLWQNRRTISIAMAGSKLIVPDSELITVPTERIQQILDSALPYYNDDGSMLFHGPHHPVDVTNTFLKDWVICAERGYVTDLEAGVGGTAHHDDNVHLPLDKEKFNTKEERSKAIAEPELEAIGFKPEQIGLSSGVIIATTAGIICKNLLEIQGVRADLANTGFPYDGFLKYFIRYSKELRNLTGVFAPFNEVKEMTIDKLSIYFSQDLRYPFEKVSPLTLKGLANLARLKRDDEATVSALAGEDFKAA